MAVIICDEYDAGFSQKGEIPEDYWECILNALKLPGGYGKGHRPDLIVDDGSNMSLLFR